MNIRVLNPSGRARRAAPRRTARKSRRKNFVGKEVLNYMKANPKRRRRAATGRFTSRKSSRRSYRARNPVGAVANLQRRPKRRRRTKGRARTYRMRNQAANPMRRRRGRRRSNPVIGDLKGLLIRGGYAIAGGIATRSIPQAILRDSNTGIIGYAANLLTAAVGGKILTMVTKSKDAGDMFLVGGIVMVAGRAVEEYFGRKVVEFAQIGIPLPGLSADPSYDMRLMGDYINQNFPLPYSSLVSGRAALPSPEAAAAGAVVAANGLGQDRTWNTPWN